MNINFSTVSEKNKKAFKENWKKCRPVIQGILPAVGVGAVSSDFARVLSYCDELEAVLIKDEKESKEAESAQKRAEEIAAKADRDRRKREADEVARMEAERAEEKGSDPQVK